MINTLSREIGCMIIESSIPDYGSTGLGSVEATAVITVEVLNKISREPCYSSILTVFSTVEVVEIYKRSISQTSR